MDIRTSAAAAAATTTTKSRLFKGSKPIINAKKQVNEEKKTSQLSQVET